MTDVQAAIETSLYGKRNVSVASVYLANIGWTTS